jgi:UDPglucose 6-dehydrogenase
MRIAVIGTGYVGLVTGAGFADFGHHVSCVDIDPNRIALLERGEVPFYEPGLGDLVARNRSAGRLAFTTQIAAAVGDAEVIFLAVGTPPLGDGNSDLSAVIAAAKDVGRALKGWAVVVTKSTVPVGSADKVRAAIASVTSHPFAVASNPEFLKEGDAVNDFLRPARVVIGVEDDKARAALEHLYAGFLRTSNRVQLMNIRSAELTKYAANAMLATRVSFMNELALLADELGADIEKIRVALGADPRIGPKFLFPGIGFGGSCFPKDLRSLAFAGRSAGVPLGIVEAAITANTRQGQVFADHILAALAKVGKNDGAKVAIWGLAFKPETDDIRESPGIALAQYLRTRGVAVAGYDPIAAANVSREHPGVIELVADAYSAAKDADALVLVTEWHELRHPDYAKLASTMRGRLLFDGRNVWDPSEARSAGFIYRGVGRS